MSTDSHQLLKPVAGLNHATQQKFNDKIVDELNKAKEQYSKDANANKASSAQSSVIEEQSNNHGGGGQSPQYNKRKYQKASSNKPMDNRPRGGSILIIMVQELSILLSMTISALDLTVILTVCTIQRALSIGSYCHEFVVNMANFVPILNINVKIVLNQTMIPMPILDLLDQWSPIRLATKLLCSDAKRNMRNMVEELTSRSSTSVVSATLNTLSALSSSLILEAMLNDFGGK